MSQKESCFPENQTFKKSFFRRKHMYHDIGLRSPYHSLAYFHNWKQNLPSAGNADVKLCLLLLSNIML